MEYCVVKTGAETFDALHAYGLGIGLAFAIGSSVDLRDIGVLYTLKSPATTVPKSTADILWQVLALPTPNEISVAEKKPNGTSLPVANLDGLLAANFTTPGVRTVSVVDTLDRTRLRPSVVQDALKKARAAITRLHAYAERTSRRARGIWLPSILQDYDVENPRMPLPTEKRASDIAIPMTLDPSFSYSTRRPISDGFVADKTGVSLRGTPSAAILAFIGAARFLRAQRVAGEMVNFYVPIATEMTLYPETSLPMLYPAEHGAEQATILQWLTYRATCYVQGTRWRCLAYQVMQTQGAQQSISRGRGFLDYSWLTTVERAVGPAVVDYWHRLLGSRREQVPFETDNLMEALAGRRPTSWLAHLREVATYLHGHPSEDVRYYSLREVKEVAAAMITQTSLPLSTVLDREKGTLQFGRSLRLLGRQKPAPLKELVAALDTVRTRDQLVRVLAWAVQECAVAKALSEFVTVPDDEDFRYLLEDIEQHGAQPIAGLLIILSTLYYPRRFATVFGEESVAAIKKIEGGKNDDQK